VVECPVVEWPVLAAAVVALRIADARGESQPAASATPASARTMP